MLFVPINVLFYGIIIISLFINNIPNEIFAAMFPFKLIVFITTSIYLYFNKKNNFIYYNNLGFTALQFANSLLLLDLILYFVIKYIVCTFSYYFTISIK